MVLIPKINWASARMRKYDYTCRTCVTELDAKYYSNNKERLKRNHKEYYENHKDECVERNKKYTNMYKDLIMAYKSRWYQDNREHVIARVSRRYQLKRDEILTYAKEYHAKLIDGDTPADRVGIKVEGQNKWLTIIQNASKEKKAV
jgi:hypothetical protein